MMICAQNKIRKALPLPLRTKALVKLLPSLHAYVLKGMIPLYRCCCRNKAIPLI